MVAQQTEKEQNRYCPNCHYPIAKGGDFCSECGQKHTTGKVTVGALLRDLAESVLNIDSKIFRTLGAMFIPGKLTVEYFKGRHKRYVPPLRLFFVMAVIFFAAFGFMVNRQTAPTMEKLQRNQEEDAFMAIFMEEFDSVRAEVEAAFPEQPEVKSAVDSLEAHLFATRSDSTNMGYIKVMDDWSLEPSELKIAMRDWLELPPRELCDRYDIQGVFNRLQVRQFLRINREGGSFMQFALGNLVWMVLLLMPALALILKLLHIRRKRYYVEHLIFSFHYNAFFFFLIVIGILTNRNFWEDGVAQNFSISIDSSFVPGLIPAVLFIYLYLAMRRVYGQGYFKTFVKYAILNFAYLLVFVFFLSVFVLVNAFLY